MIQTKPAEAVAHALDMPPNAATEWERRTTARLIRSDGTMDRIAACRLALMDAWSRIGIAPDRSARWADWMVDEALPRGLWSPGRDADWYLWRGVTGDLTVTRGDHYRAEPSPAAIAIHLGTVLRPVAALFEASAPFEAIEHWH